MTIEELKELRWINSSFTSARPSDGMTDKQWQQKFEVMKSIAIPSPCPKMKKTSSLPFKIVDGEYCGDTMNQYYTLFINSVLKNIRAGKIEFCYFAYQISDLLRFEPVRLFARYSPTDEYWTVWLEGGNSDR